jgi:hypothetical protein
MYRDLLSHTPLLALPMIALFLFLAVWLAMVARAITRGRSEVEAAARLPLEEDRHER